MSFGVVDEQGNYSDEHRIPTGNSWDEIKTHILKEVREFLNTYDDIVGLGFGAAGLISLDGFAFYSPNVAAFNGGKPLHADLASELDIPVFVDNDNNCVGLAEVMFGSARGSNNVLTVGLGTGIGGAIVVDGKIFRGTHGFAADVGHFTMDINGPLCACGKYGCFEAFASGSALGRIGREYAERGDAPNVLTLAGSVEGITGDHVGQAATEGKPDGIAIIDEYAHNLAIGLASLSNILDPEIIVISGGVVELGNILLEPVTKYFLDDSQGDASRPLARVVLAKFGIHAGLIGAGALALSSVR